MNTRSLDRTIRMILAPVLALIGVLVGPGSGIAIVLYALAALLLATAADTVIPSALADRIAELLAGT